MQTPDRSSIDREKLLEDLADLAVVAERRDEPVISREAFLADLKRDGTLGRSSLALGNAPGIFFP